MLINFETRLRTPGPICQLDPQKRSVPKSRDAARKSARATSWLTKYSSKFSCRTRSGVRNLDAASSLKASPRRIQGEEREGIAAAELSRRRGAEMEAVSFVGQSGGRHERGVGDGKGNQR